MDTLVQLIMVLFGPFGSQQKRDESMQLQKAGNIQVKPEGSSVIWAEALAGCVFFSMLGCHERFVIWNSWFLQFFPPKVSKKRIGCIVEIAILKKFVTRKKRKKEPCGGKTKLECV